MFTIRRQLKPSEGAPPDTRVNPDTGEVETSVDGGATWTPNPQGDPRTNPVYLLPPPEVVDVRCATAAGMVENVRKVVDAATLGVGLGGIATVLITLLLIPGIGWMFAAMLLFAGSVAAAGAGAVAAAFDEDVYDWLLCAFFGAVDAEGRITAADLADIQAGAAAEFPDPLVGDTLAGIFDMHKEVGFTNAGVVYADDEAECDCPVAYKWDFTVSAADWAVVADRGAGCCFGGLGFVSVYNFGGLGNTEIRIASPSQPGKTLTRYIVVYSAESVPDQTGLAIAQTGGGYTFDANSGLVTADMLGTFVIEDGFWRLDISANGVDAPQAIKSLTIYPDSVLGLTGGEVVPA